MSTKAYKESRISLVRLFTLSNTHCAACQASDLVSYRHCPYLSPAMLIFAGVFLFLVGDFIRMTTSSAPGHPYEEIFPTEVEATTSASSSTNTTWPYTFSSQPFPYPLNSSVHTVHPITRWEKAHQKARIRLTNWTLEEKVILTTGTGWEIGRCVGNIPALPTQNFSGLCLEDSPLGVRYTDFVSAFPAGINVAST